MLTQRLKEQLSECVSSQVEDEGDVIGVPHPYSVPTPGERFHCLFYWDTYFTNLGLIATGNLQQALWNVTDMISLVERFGFVPNGNMKRYLSRSQPPFLAMMVEDVYERTGDNAWLTRAYAALKREHAFWVEERGFASGLSHYGRIPPRELIEAYAARWRERSGIDLNAEGHLLAGRYLTQAESGWDMNPRWGLRAWEYAPPDLNALLWRLETALARFAEILETGEGALWRERGEERRCLMDEFLWDPQRGAYLDRSPATGERGTVLSAASFYPLFVGMADGARAARTVELLPLLERARGVCPCEPHGKAGIYQWDAPNLWPCLQWIVYKALHNYGYVEEARRVAEKYTSVVEENEARTGQLWEKYNADSGSCNVINEYPMPPMLGWSAGVYLKFKVDALRREGDGSTGGSEKP